MKLSKGMMVAYCLPEFARGIFTTMIANYLVYFYQPSVESGIPTLVSQSVVFFGIFTVIGLIKAIGQLIDAVTDPLVASLSDKWKGKKGRRIPFMKWFAIPYGLCALLIFWAPAGEPGLLNNIWIAAFIWGYFIFYTLYVIPYIALLPEMIDDEKLRVNTYTLSSFMFVTGSAVGYVTPVFVSLWKNAGFAALEAWRYTFVCYTVVGLLLLLIPAFLIDEKKYVHSVKPSAPFFASLKHAFSNRHFCWLTVAALLENIAMSFFQTCIMYYVVTLLGLSEAASTPILAISIVGSLIMYPFINKHVKKKGKKGTVIAACVVFTIAELIIFIGADWPFPAMAKAIALALVFSFPFAALNILPNAMMSDVIQYDTIKTGVNQEGIFSAARSFVTKVGGSFSIMLVPTIIKVGAAAGENVGRYGLKLTGLIGGIICIGAVIGFSFYQEKKVLGTIAEYRAAKGEK